MEEKMVDVGLKVVMWLLVVGLAMFWTFMAITEEAPDSVDKVQNMEDFE